MNKRIAALLCALMCLFGTAALAGGFMTVVNCESWVSLRQETDSGSKRVCKVPLGATVQNCETAENGFVRCEYNGHTGYILAEYLQQNGHGTMARAAQVDYGELTRDGKQLLCAYAGESTVLAARVNDPTGEGEMLRVGAFDSAFRNLWGFETATDEMMQYYATDAFWAEADGHPYVMVYNSQIGLMKLDAMTGSCLWTLPWTSVRLGGCISHAVAADGTMYICGYEGPDPVAISPEGTVLWQSYSGNEDCYGAYQMVLTADGGLDVTYESNDAVVHYGADGSTVSESISATADVQGNVPETVNSQSALELSTATLPYTVWDLYSAETDGMAWFAAQNTVGGSITFGAGTADLDCDLNGEKLTRTGAPYTFTIGAMYEGCPNAEWWAWLEGGKPQINFTFYRQNGLWRLEMRYEDKNAATVLLFLLRDSTVTEAVSTATAPMLWTDFAATPPPETTARVSDGSVAADGTTEERGMIGGMNVLFARYPAAGGDAYCLSRILAECGLTPVSLQMTMTERAVGQTAEWRGDTAGADKRVSFRAAALTVGGYDYLFLCRYPTADEGRYAPYIDSWMQNLRWCERSAAVLP